MLIFRTFACDGGGELAEHTFELLIDTSDENEGRPSFCPRCGCEVAGDIEPLPAKVSIGGSAASRAVDMTYDLVERSSLERAALAEEAGLTPAQARSLKVTDMHDNLREGDVAAKLPLPNNPVGQFMKAAEQAGVQYGFQRAGTPGGGVYNGPMTAPSGARRTGPMNEAAQAIQGGAGTEHQQTRQQLIAAGQINKRRSGS